MKLPTSGWDFYDDGDSTIVKLIKIIVIKWSLNNYLSFPTFFPKWCTVRTQWRWKKQSWASLGRIRNKIYWRTRKLGYSLCKVHQFWLKSFPRNRSFERSSPKFFLERDSNITFSESNFKPPVSKEKFSSSREKAIFAALLLRLDQLRVAASNNVVRWKSLPPYSFPFLSYLSRKTNDIETR